MAKDLGWIKLYRSSFNNKHYFSEPFTRWQAWTDLLLIANHTIGWVRIRGIKQEVLRGQIGHSMPILCKRWTWSKGKVLRYLNELRDEHQVVLQKTNITTLISIVNYNKYQTDNIANEFANSIANNTADSTANGFADSTLTRMIKNDKEENNKNNFGGVSPPEPPVLYLPKYTDFNGLPENYFEQIFKTIKSTKQVEVSKEDVWALWEVFKEQNLTGEKAYNFERDVYRHFCNWTNKQSFRKKTVPREPKQKIIKSEIHGVVGVEFLNEYTQVKMSDNTIQDLTVSQTESAKFNLLNPTSIKKK